MNEQEQAFPMAGKQVDGKEIITSRMPGMTKLEYVAVQIYCAAPQPLIEAAGELTKDSEVPMPEALAEVAIGQARVLLRLLEAQK